MYQWLVDLLEIPSYQSSSSIIYLAGAILIMVAATTLSLFIMILDRILNGGWRK